MIAVQQSRPERAAGWLLTGSPVLPFVPSTPALLDFHTHKMLFVAFPTPHTLTTHLYDQLVCACMYTSTQVDVQMPGGVLLCSGEVKQDFHAIWPGYKLQAQWVGMILK